MKLPNFYNFDALNSLRQQMGAELIDDYKFYLDPSKRLTREEQERLLSVGGIDIADLNEIIVLPDKTIALKDSRTLLHIRDINHYGHGTDLPRFHFAWCSTLETMKNNNRFGRYVTAASDKGEFEIIHVARSHQRQKVKLDVCMNCLDCVSYKDYKNKNWSARNLIKNDFSIKDYFEQYPRNYLKQKPLHTSISAPINQYPENWNAISLRYKTKMNFTCEKADCRINLSSFDHRKFIQVHHRNGQKNECQESNLECLCLGCHAQEPMHNHMKTQRLFSEFQAFRRGFTSYGEMSTSTYGGLQSGPQDNYQPENSDCSVVTLAHKNNVTCTDNRNRGGAFWVNYDTGTGDFAITLEKLGFKYRQGRGWWKP